MFFVALGFQLASRAFTPFLYWTVILATSTAGTTISDFMDRTLAFGYAKGSLCLALLLVVLVTVTSLRDKSARSSA